MTTVYDVTTFPATGGVTAQADIGAVMNQIIADIKANQTTDNTRPGAVIYIPPGHYDLKTRVVIDISFLQIKGSGHGFISRALKDIFAPATNGWYEVQPGGSHIRVVNTDGHSEAFLVARGHNNVMWNRLNSIEFRDFNIDGVSESVPRDPYLPGTGSPNAGNGKIGIKVEGETDSFRVEGMAMQYLNYAVRGVGFDNPRFHHNYILECGEGISIQSFCPNITDNVFYTTWTGNCIAIDGTNLAYGCENAKVVGNSFMLSGGVFMKHVARSLIASNVFRSGWPGLITLDETCEEVLITSNSFYRDDSRSQVEDGVVVNTRLNGKDETYGVIKVRGYGNTIVANHFSFVSVFTENTPNPSTVATLISVDNGHDNFISTNNVLHNKPMKIVLGSQSTNTKILWTMNAGEVDAAAGATYTHVPVP